jgi:hypothetical protein
VKKGLAAQHRQKGSEQLQCRNDWRKIADLRALLPENIRS